MHTKTIDGDAELMREWASSSVYTPAGKWTARLVYPSDIYASDGGSLGDGIW